MTILGETVWVLPPLILHPFNERVPPSALLENSKAALMLSGLIPNDGSNREQLEHRLLTGRYSEIRMLFYLGKDVFRWLEQCMGWVEHVPELKGAELHSQSFAGLLISDPPEVVREKLIRWGVVDFVSIFSRAIGLNAVFSDPPDYEVLSQEFLRHYHRYADSLYQCYMDSQPHRAIVPKNFRFELYASGEYSRLLEAEWGTT
ncbi:MAG TPA: hypothetical protein VE959_29250 [Bryobacteraceae bacterium]|nr:hypothetical protein [Bryobacteraceae bacterium]